MPVKIARKPSTDAVQEKLRQDKAAWNKEVSLFINDVIHLKKLMNGWPSKFFKERSRIVQPIPADPATIIGSLANDFQQLAQRGSGLVEEQLNYAKVRRQKQLKAPAAPVPETSPTEAPATPAAPASAPAPDLSKQLAAWEHKYELVSEASNPLSRFLVQRVTRTRGLGDKVRNNRIRMDMLRSCVKAYRALGKLQINVVKGSKNSVGDAYKMMQNAWHEWSIVARGFTAFKSNLTNQPVVPSGADLPEEKEGQEPPLESTPLPALVVPPSSPPTVVPPVVTPVIEPKKEEVLPKAASVQLEVVSQAFIKKWLGKKRHQFMPQSNSSYRLEVFKLATQARKDINEVMNVLEKSLDPTRLDELITQVNRQMTSLRMLMRSLHLSEKPDAAGALPL
jgi:hypothetical protein